MKTNFLMEPETEPDLVVRILRHQIKESRRYKVTVPYHSVKACEDKTKCAFHRKRVR